MNTTDSVIIALENAPRIIVPLAREVPASILKRRPQPNKWSAHEHISHLANVHQLFFARLELMLANPEPVIKPYLPDLEDEDDFLLKMNLEEALDRYQRERRELVEKLKALTADDWEKSAEHGEYNRYTVFIMFRHLAMHDMLHAYRVEELLLKKDWE